MENKKLTTPMGKELIVKPFLTARDRNQLRAVFLKDTKIDSKTGEAAGEYSGTAIEEAEKVMIRLAIVSYDGQTDPSIVLEALLNGSPKEYDFVVQQASHANAGSLT